MRTCDQSGCTGTEGEIRLLPKGPGRWDQPKKICRACWDEIIMPTGNWHLRWGNLSPVVEKDCQAASDCGTVAREILTEAMQSTNKTRTP